MTPRTLASLVGVLLIGMSAGTWSQIAGESVSLRSPSDDDVYAAARYVEILAPVDGDAVLAGQSVIIAAPVASDLTIAAETARVRAPVGDDVRVAARSASLQADIGGHVVAAGQSVSLDPGVAVGGWAWLAGERVIVRGDVGGELKAAGASIRIAGRIGGDAELAGGRVHIESSAVIGGDVTVRSEQEPTIEEGARIAGQLVHLSSPVETRDDQDWDVAGWLFITVAVAVTLLAYYWLFPQFARHAASALTAEPLKALGLGLAAALVTPLVILVLLLTGIGFLVALPLGAVYLVLLLAGYLGGLYTVAELVARRTGRDEAARGALSLILVATVVAAALVTLIPVLGSLALLVLWLLGVGAVVAVLYRRYGAPASQPS